MRTIHYIVHALRNIETNNLRDKGLYSSTPLVREEMYKQGWRPNSTPANRNTTIRIEARRYPSLVELSEHGLRLTIKGQSISDEDIEKEPHFKRG